MQLYALQDGFPIVASRALKGIDYCCPECNSPVRVRGGHARQIHFYHLKKTKFCRQNQKSAEHLQTQIHLFNSIGPDDAALEYRFSEVGRIADVAWISRKIIFEVQCSPISLEEVKARLWDYQKMGFEVFWILHDGQFNQERLSASENFLREIPCYFTNMDKKGRGMIYDQFEVINEGRRFFKGPPVRVFPVGFSQLPPFTERDQKIPAQLLSRLSIWKFYVTGDLLDRFFKNGISSLSAAQMITIEKKSREGKIGVQKRLSLLSLGRKSYLFLLEWLLKKII